MDELVQWLHAQLDEDERIARGCSGMEWWEHPKNWVSAPQLHRIALVVHDGDRSHITRHDPARVLREIDARRQIVALHSVSEGHECSTRDRHGDIDNCTWVMDTEACTTLRLLALPYADRPGYRDEWRT